MLTRGLSSKSCLVRAGAAIAIASKADSGVDGKDAKTVEALWLHKMETKSHRADAVPAASEQRDSCGV